MKQELTERVNAKCLLSDILLRDCLWHCGEVGHFKVTLVLNEHTPNITYTNNI